MFLLCKMKLHILTNYSNERLLNNKLLCYNYYPNMLNIVLFTQEFNFTLERTWHPAILQSIFESLFCNYLFEVISLSNVAVIGEINKNFSIDRNLRWMQLPAVELTESEVQTNMCSSQPHTHTCVTMYRLGNDLNL